MNEMKWKYTYRQLRYRKITMNIVSKDENKKLIESEKRVLEFIAKTMTRYYRTSSEITLSLFF